jgi:hypothetical protein
MPTADPVPAADPRGQRSTELVNLWQTWWRRFGLRAPLSGDVVQDLVDPSLLRDQAQLGFLNINATRAGDPALEQRIITEVASYGRQLGRLIDAVGVLARHQERGGLTFDDQHALDQLQDLAEQIAATKTRAAAERIDHIVADVRALRADPETNHDALRRLREALADG